MAALVGLLGGGLTGFASVWFEQSRQTVAQEDQEPAAFVRAHPLQGYCGGPDEPAIVLYWALPNGVAKNSLYRAQTNAAAELVFNGRAGNKRLSIYTDTGIEFNRAYTYHFKTDSGVTSNFITIKCE